MDAFQNYRLHQVEKKPSVLSLSDKSDGDSFSAKIDKPRL